MHVGSCEENPADKIPGFFRDMLHPCDYEHIESNRVLFYFFKSITRLKCALKIVRLQIFLKKSGEGQLFYFLQIFLY